ncbi:MAG: hypothetical protein GWN64_14800 [Candidatus Thorarchaeota archaeon]|nr:hypothetical protein [Candidatus Thorarchaeota archaeon]
MRKIIKVLDWDGKFVCNAFIRGVEYVNGKEGWFTSVTLLSLTGEKLYAWKHMIEPYTLLLEEKVCTKKEM